MKRGKKLILLTAILAVFVAVTLIVQGAVSKNRENAQTATSVTFLTVDPATVTGLSWTYNTETVTLGYAGGQWTNMADAAFPVDATIPNQMLGALKEVTASRAFDAGDSSEYGLDAPAYTITVDAGTQTTLTVGSASAISGELYASIGDGKIYLVQSSLLDAFKHGSADILQKEPIPDMTALKGIDLSTKTGELNMTYLDNSPYTYSDSYHWFLLKNGTYQVLGSPADTLAKSLSGLKWISCENYNASDDDLKTYGLDNPNATVILSYDAAAKAPAATAAPESTAAPEATEASQTAGATAAETQPATFVLEIGSFTDAGYYARIQGSKMVYVIDSTLAQSVLNATAESLKPTDICPLNWDTVSSFDVTLDGATYAFTRGTKDVTGADGKVSQQAIFLMNGAEVDSALVQAVLDDLTNMKSTGTVAQALGAEEISFGFHRNTETFPEISLAFYRADSTSCIVGFNGETRLTAARADLVSLIEAVNAIVLH